MTVIQSNRVSGFSLVEVSIAMAIAAVAMVSLIGLIPQGLISLQDAGDRAIYGRIHQQILSEIQLTPFRPESGYSGSGGLKSSNSPLKDFHEQIRIYDAQGVELGYLNKGGSFEEAVSFASTRKGSEPSTVDWVYSARIWLPVFAGDMPPSLGGRTSSGVVLSSKDSVGSENLLSVIIEIIPFRYPDDEGEPTHSSADKFLVLENSRLIHHFQSMVVRMGTDYVK